MYEQELIATDLPVAVPVSADMYPDFEDFNLSGLPGPKVSILDTIGHTPVVRINNLGVERVSIFAKLEAFNPMGSVKDRLALSVIEEAERSGALTPGRTVVEATSGNTGIGLAMVCAQKGYPLVIVMAENFSVERRKLLRFLGARVVLTPASEKGTGMLAKARELADAHGWFLPEQFSNPANSAVHARTTAIEILADFNRISLDYWVTGFGTGGTLRGVAGMLKRHRPATRVVVAEPDNAPMLASGVDNTDGGHPLFRPHPMQGWSPDFLSRFALEAREGKLVDTYVAVSGAAAMDAARRLAAAEGILAGVTGGATIAAALEIAKTAEEGANILAMVPDTGERYLSTPLFDGVDAEMNAAEHEISRSTANYRFDTAKPAPAPVAAAAVPEADAKAIEFVEAEIRDPEEPVVMFALEWCEFCWSVRKFLESAGIRYKSVDLDTASFSGGQDFAGEVRKELRNRTGAPTIPQIFVGGEPIGGATDLFDAFNDGSLRDILGRAGIALDASAIPNAYDFLPKWLHARG